MTSFWHRFAPKGAVVAVALTMGALAGCGKREPEVNPIDALVNQAREQLKLGELKAARETIAKAVAEVDGGRKGGVSVDDADIVLIGAQLAYHAKDYQAAAKAFADFAADAKRDAKMRADALVGLAVVEMTRSDGNARGGALPTAAVPVKARIALMKAMKLDRRNAAARYHLGLLYRSLGYEEAALEQFEAYVMLEKDDAPHVQRVQRQLIPALREQIARKATERPGVNMRNSSQSAAQLAKAEAEFKKGNFKTARAKYSEALKSDPLSYPAALGLAKSWEKSDGSESGRRNALEAYQTACSLKPGAIATLNKTGSLAYAAGRYAMAVEAYSRAIAADPRNAEALDGIIRSLKKIGGDGAKAASLWQTYRK